MNRRGVAASYVKSGKQLVPKAPSGKKDWTYGVNSGARFAAMLGQTIVDYDKFKSDAPSHSFLAF